MFSAMLLAVAAAVIGARETGWLAGLGERGVRVYNRALVVVLIVLVMSLAESMLSYLWLLGVGIPASVIVVLFGVLVVVFGIGIALVMFRGR